MRVTTTASRTLASAFRGGGLAALLAASCAIPGCTDDVAAAPTTTLAWKPCYDGFECATIDVPVDYAAPDAGTLALALLRAPAEDREARVGTVIVNPGGPGIAMVEQLAATYRTLKIGFPVALSRLDLVAFDWRGVGASAPLSCVDDRFFDELRTLDLTLEEPSSVALVDAARHRLQEGCRARADERLLRNVGTVSAARDLERIRIALGEEKLNYLGFSYGTHLGATYATLYPSRVRAFVLDAPVALEGDLGAQLALRARAFDHGLTRFAEACARDTQCALRSDGSPSAVLARLDALATKARAEGMEAADRRVSAVDLSYALADGLRVGDPRRLAVDLAKAEAGDASVLLARADKVAGRRPDGTYDSTLVGLLSIACLDQPLAEGTTTHGFRSLVHALAPTPRARGAAGIPFALCVDWPWKRTTPGVVVDARIAPPMLVVAGRNDPLSTFAMAGTFLARLGNGSHLVTYEGDGHIGATHSQCVRDAITDFVLDPSQPPRAASCPGD